MNNNFYDTIIIGGGTAGLTAAIYTSRRSKSVLVLENSSIGGQISFSPCVENYPGFEKISGSEFSDKLYEQAIALGAEINFESVCGIEFEDGKKIVISEDGDIRRRCNKIIVATGTEHRKLGVPGEEELFGSGVSYCAVCDGAFYRGRTVCIIGGGSAALQSARLLSEICEKVYLIHRRDEFRGENRLVEQLKEIGNIEFVLSSVVEKINGESNVSGITVKNLKTDEVYDIALDGVFVYVGKIPQNEIFRGVLELDPSGYIVADEDCRTNIDGVYATGDCRTKKVRQLTTAAADGTVAALAD